jgi:hypothetical protein
MGMPWSSVRVVTGKSAKRVFAADDPEIHLFEDD